MLTQEIKEYTRIEVLADIVVENKLKKFTAVTFNISLGGMSFVSSGVLETGERCRVFLKRNRNIFQTKGTIKWTRFADAGQDMIVYGLEFKEPIDQNTLELFIKCCN